MATKRLIPTTIDNNDAQHHFFASSAARWTVGYDLQAIITRMKRDGYPFNVYLVPGPESRPYEISFFIPNVEGVVFLAFYGPTEQVKRAEERVAAATKKQAAME